MTEKLYEPKVGITLFAIEIISIISCLIVIIAYVRNKEKIFALKLVTYLCVFDLIGSTNVLVGLPLPLIEYRPEEV